MLLEMPAPIVLSSAALAVAALAWLKWPLITTRFYQERHSRDFRLWEVALTTAPRASQPSASAAASPVAPARKRRRFEIAVYLSIKRCK